MMTNIDHVYGLVLNDSIQQWMHNTIQLPHTCTRQQDSGREIRGIRHPRWFMIRAKRVSIRKAWTGQLLGFQESMVNSLRDSTIKLFSSHKLYYAEPSNVHKTVNM